MAINIYTVANHLEENGWQLLSTEYKNLKSPLKMKCPEGHEIEDTYEHWRKHMLCDKCLASDDYAVKKNKVPIKKIDTHRILALDAATNITGFSIYDNDVLNKVLKDKETYQLVIFSEDMIYVIFTPHVVSPYDA